MLNQLRLHGRVGMIGAALLNCQKESSNAKKHLKGHAGAIQSRRLSRERYQQKHQAMAALQVHLKEYQTFNWGWAPDPNPSKSSAVHVLYVDLPTGQVGFHSTQMLGRNAKVYTGQWDGQNKNMERIFKFCEDILNRKITNESQT